MMLEFVVSPETAPYLVSSSKGMVWIEAAMTPTKELWPGETPAHVVRVAVRKDVKTEFFAEVVEHVAAKGRELEWGNVHEPTPDGVGAAIAHVRGYDLGDLCLLHSRENLLFDWGDGQSIKAFALANGCLIQPCSWLKSDTVVIVPKNREFLGTIGYMGRKGTVVVVHNAARGMAIATRA